MSSVLSPQSSVLSPNCILKFLTVSLKIIVSGILALIILSAGCYFYYNQPSHYTDKDGVTGYRNEVNVFYCLGREGFGLGYTNNEGYTNVEDYVPSSEIELLLMGSSHMAASNIIQEYSAASLLSSEYGVKVYNVAMPGHQFHVCAAGLRAGISKYRPSKFTIIETSAVGITEKNVNDILHNTVSKPSAYDKGILSLLRRNNYLRLLYHQFVKPALNNNNSIPEKLAGREILSEMLAKLNKDVSLSGAKLIIAYHPSVSLNKDGTMKIDDDPEVVKQFSELCAENGIYFLNMAERFLEEYKKDYTLPYGFANSSVGKGHMNVHGHRMFADEIYKLIQRIGAGS